VSLEATETVKKTTGKNYCESFNQNKTKIV